MECATRQTKGEPTPASVSKLFLESTLLRVAGALFCHNQKTAANHTGEIKVTGPVAEKNIIVRPDPNFGQPGPLAHKLFVAILKKHSDYGRPVRGEVSFSKRELMRLVGRKKWGGRDSAQLTRALHEIHHTFVRASFQIEPGKWAEHSFNVFPEIYVERARTTDDPIERCIVSLASPIVRSLQDEHFTCLNHGLMQTLGTIGQALYMRLFFHFGNLYDGHHETQLSFVKRYDDICRDWLGGLKVHAHRSLIERDQLGPHLRDLLRAGFLSSYAIRKAKTGSGMVLTFRPGRAFFCDYERFYRQRSHGEIEFHDDRRQVAEPVKVAYLFLEKRDRQPLAAISYVSSRDVETAKQILAAVHFDDVGEFLDYALTEADKTNFKVQSLGGLKQYLAGYASAKQRIVAARIKNQQRQAEVRQQALIASYEQFRNKKADAILRSLPAAERSRIEAMANAKASPNPMISFMDDTLTKIACRRIVIERYAGRIPSLGEWEAKFQQP